MENSGNIDRDGPHSTPITTLDFASMYPQLMILQEDIQRFNRIRKDKDVVYQDEDSVFVRAPQIVTIEKSHMGTGKTIDSLEISKKVQEQLSAMNSFVKKYTERTAEAMDDTRYYEKTKKDRELLESSTRSIKLEKGAPYIGKVPITDPVYKKIKYGNYTSRKYHEGITKRINRYRMSNTIVKQFVIPYGGDMILHMNEKIQELMEEIDADSYPYVCNALRETEEGVVCVALWR